MNQAAPLVGGYSKATLPEKKRKIPRRQREHPLHQFRKRRHIGSKSCESPSPEGKREASVGKVGFWQHTAPRHQNYNDCFGFQWHVWLKARRDQDSIRAAGVASSLIKNTGVKEIMLSQMVYGGEVIWLTVSHFAWRLSFPVTCNLSCLRLLLMETQQHNGNRCLYELIFCNKCDWHIGQDRADYPGLPFSGFNKLERGK
eukprot:1140774-Pelagomonas_calceolata.AAC.1